MISVYFTSERTDSREFTARVLREACGIAEPVFRTSENGKPYLAENPIYFNLSHSGEVTAIALSKSEVGLDIQLRDGTPRPALSRRLSPAEREEDFFKVWTAKEAYIKYRGGTLAKMLPALEFKAGTLYENGTPAPAALFFAEIGGYALCVCSRAPQPVTLYSL